MSSPVHGALSPVVPRSSTNRRASPLSTAARLTRPGVELIPTSDWSMAPLRTMGGPKSKLQLSSSGSGGSGGSGPRWVWQRVPAGRNAVADEAKYHYGELHVNLCECPSGERPDQMKRRTPTICSGRVQPAADPTSFFSRAQASCGGDTIYCTYMLRIMRKTLPASSHLRPTARVSANFSSPRASITFNHDVECRRCHFASIPIRHGQRHPPTCDPGATLHSMMST